MKNLKNIIVTFLLLFVGNMVFPKYIEAENWKKVIIATLVMIIAEIITGILIFLILGILVLVDKPWIAIIVTIGLSILIIPVALLACSSYVPGFELHGIWTYIILTVLLSVLTASDTNDSKKNEK